MTLFRRSFNGGYDGRGMGYGYGHNPLDDRMAIAYSRGRGMGGLGGRDRMGYDPNYPNQAYQGQNHPNKIGGYTRGMMGPGVGLGGTMLLGEGIKRILKHHVLYLLIVNMPTEEEMAQAIHVMDQAQAQAHEQSG